jgi:4'-phosphopantetheinyl transferase
MNESATWSPATLGIQLGPNEVHIWRARLDVDPTVRERLSDLLSLREQERVARFSFVRDRDHFVVCRAILRQILGGYLGKAPQDVLIETPPYGKPSLAPATDIPTLRFNLSHSYGFALYVFSSQHEVGIDVEKFRPEVDFEGIESYFSPTERRELDALPQELRPEGFFLCWTRKEAYVKAKGDGLHTPLASFDVSLTPDQPVVLNSSDQERWTLYSLRPDPAYFGALVAEGRGHRLRFWEWHASIPSQSM